MPEQEKYLDSIKNLIAGKACVGLSADDPFSAALIELCEKITREKHEDLEYTVDLSVGSSEVLASVSFVTGDVKEISQNTGSIASAMEELGATIREISHSSEGVLAAVRSAEEFVRNGQNAVEESIQSVENIASTVNDANDKLSTLSDAVDAITEILGTIEAIAKQTNLLALNATIEAARAGAAGKGFAVVASEVKGLAGETSKATDDILHKINAIMQGMKDVSGAMKNSVEQVECGKGSIYKAGEEISHVVESVSNVTEAMSITAASVTEQASAIDEIARSVDVIKHRTDLSLENANRAVDVSTKSAKQIDSRLEKYAQMDIPDSVMDFARSDHVSWKKNLAAMLVGRSNITSDELSDHHHCRLGKWYNAQKDTSITNLRDFIDLEKPHAAVHDHGKKVADLFARGDLSGALEEYQKMSEFSEKVIDHLNAIKMKRD